MKMRSFFVLGVIAFLGLVGAAAQSLHAAEAIHYQFKDMAEPAYAVTVQAELPDSVQTQSGYIFYFIKNVDPANGQITLGYSTSLHTTTTRPQQDNRFPPRIGPPDMGQIFAPPPAPAEIIIDNHGKIVSSNRMNEGDQLPYLLGFAWQLMLQPLSADATWKTERDLAIYDKPAQPQQRQWPPPPPWMRQQPQQEQPRTERAAHETITYTQGAPDGNAVPVTRAYEMSTAEMNGNSPALHQSGDGQFIFDNQLGLIRSLDMKMVIEVNQKNVTVKVPVTVSARICTAEEIAKFKAERVAAEARARDANEQFQKRVAQDNKERNAPPPSEEETAAQMKKIATLWQPTTGHPVNLLPTMTLVDPFGGHRLPNRPVVRVEHEADGTTILNAGQKLSTGANFRVPATFRVVVYSHLTDTRFNFAGADELIFDWEMNHDELRIGGGPANGNHKPGAGRLSASEWSAVEFVVHRDEMIIYVNGEERHRVQADFSKADKPFIIWPQNGSIRVKSLQIVR